MSSGSRGSRLLDPADLIGRVISGVIAARMLPQRVEGGPELDPYADSIPSYVDSGLVYWHLMHVWLQPLYSAWLPRPRQRWWRRAREADDHVKTGLIVETTKGTVAVADVGDDYAIGAWPDDARWKAISVVTDVDPRRIRSERRI